MIRGARRCCGSHMTWCGRSGTASCPGASGSPGTAGSRTRWRPPVRWPPKVARHRIRAAVDEPTRRNAATACREAAAAAARGLDYAEAVRWYGRALEVVPGDPATLLARAEAAFRDGQLDVALADCATALDIAEDRHDAGLAAEAALVIRGLAGHHGPALLVLSERARALLGDEDSSRHAQVLAQHAFLLAEAGDNVRAEPMTRAAMTMAERSGGPRRWPRRCTPGTRCWIRSPASTRSSSWARAAARSPSPAGGRTPSCGAVPGGSTPI